MAAIVSTPALIIKENNNIGEADRFVTALTEELGVVRASARGAQKIKSRNAGATRLLCYSQLSLVQGRDKYIIDEARPIHAFLGLGSDIEKLALAQYFCELAGVLAPLDEPAADQLRLLCTALYHLERGTRPPALLKAVAEMRLLTWGGYMPDLSVCARCGKETADGAWLSPREGRLFCRDCGCPPNGLAVPAGVLAALRHTVSAPAEKCFGFSLGEESLSALEQVAEAYLLCQTGRSFRTLDFYKSLHNI